MNTKQKAKQKESSDGLVMFVVVIFVVLTMILMSGCGTIQGAASDIELVSGAVRKGLEPTMERRRQDRLDRATELIIAEKGDRNTNQ